MLGTGAWLPGGVPKGQGVCVCVGGGGWVAQQSWRMQAKGERGASCTRVESAAMMGAPCCDH